MARTALIGGTGLLASTLFAAARPLQVETEYGPAHLLEADGDEFLLLQRHGPDRYDQPHRINHPAHLTALKGLGVDAILAVGSVGSLRPEIPPGSVVIPDDFYAPHANPSLFDDQRSHRTPGFHPGLRKRLLAAFSDAGEAGPIDGGVYWQTRGPRFETPAEIRAHQPIAHLVGMTVASECILAGELEIPYAALCMVDNMANGLAPETLSFESFQAQVTQNREELVRLVERLLPRL